MKALLAVTLASLLLAAPAAAAEPRDPAGSAACRRGAPACVDRVIAEMKRRWRPLDRACDHRAPFALLYLRTTQAFERSLRTLDYDDPAAVIREDAEFARLYFRAFDAAAAGDARRVPGAWGVAYDAAAARTQTSVGDALLGVSAHINRDLPTVLYALHRAGHPVSRADHDRVDEVLRLVDAEGEIAGRYDPPLPGAPPPDREMAVETVVSWRATAFATYLRLRRAPSRAARAAVRAELEAGTLGLAELIREATRGGYQPGGSSCATARQVPSPGS